MRRFFDRKMSPEKASRGRWRAGLSEAEQGSVNEAYERAIAALEAQGYPSGSILRRAYERFG